MLGPGPLEIPGNRQAEPLPIGQREGLHHSTSRKWSAPRGRSRLWKFVCSREWPFQLEESRKTSRTSGLALQGRVGFQHAEMGRASAWQSKRWQQEDAGLGVVGAERSLHLPSFHPITPNFVLFSDPPAPYAFLKFSLLP